jgi:hypothetical protein
MTCRDALLLVLDQVDYTAGACSLTEMVGAVLPKEVIQKAREALHVEQAPTVPSHAELGARKDRLENDARIAREMNR